MNSADKMIRMYLFIDMDSLFLQTHGRRFYYRTKVQQFLESEMGIATKKSRRLQRDSIEKTLQQLLVGFHYPSGQGVSLANGLQKIHTAGQARQVNLDLVVAFSVEALYLLADSIEEADLFDVFAVDIHHVLDGIRIDAEQTFF